MDPSDHSKARPPIHKQGLAGHESGIVASEKDDRGGYLDGPRKSPHRHFGQIALLALTSLWIVLTEQLGFSGTWSDGICRNTIAGEFNGHRSRQALEYALCRSVDRPERKPAR